MDDTRPPVTIGHNRPTVPAPADIQVYLGEEHADLTRRRDELLDVLPDYPEVIESDDECGQVQDFVGQLSAASKRAEKQRVDAKEPYLAGERAVDGFFKGIKEPIDKAIKLLDVREKTYLRKKRDEEQRRRQEEERKAREEADRAAREAAEAAAKLTSEQDLDRAIEAEEAAKRAAAEAEEAAKAAQAKSVDLTRTRSSFGGVASLSTVWVHDEDTLDRSTLDLEALRPHLPEAALHQSIRAFIKAGGRKLAGVNIREDDRLHRR